MKKAIIVALSLVIAMSVMFAGCSKKKAIWLKDGQTLVIIDNTLGEGEKNNLRFTHTFANSVVEEGKGYVYVLPVSESNPAVRYLVSVKHGTSSELIEITNVKNGAKLSSDKFLTSGWGNFWNQGMLFVCGASAGSAADTTAHYSSVVTTTKYCYRVTKNNNMTVWGDKLLAVTITSSEESINLLSFTVEIKSFMKLPMILSHKGDSWEIK